MPEALPVTSEQSALYLAIKVLDRPFPSPEVARILGSRGFSNVDIRSQDPDVLANEERSQALTIVVQQAIEGIADHYRIQHRRYAGDLPRQVIRLRFGFVDSFLHGVNEVARILNAYPTTVSEAGTRAIRIMRKQSGLKMLEIIGPEEFKERQGNLPQLLAAQNVTPFPRKSPFG